MRPVQSMLVDIQSHYEADPDLARVVLNATSWFEASLALGVLGESIPARALVTCANTREVIKELPRCPLAMSVDLESLARMWSLERGGMSWTRWFGEGDDAYGIALLGEGNFLYDIVIHVDGRTLMMMPSDRTCDFVNPEFLDLALERPEILASIVDLTTTMGMPFYPMFYMSLEDWQREYATAIFGEVLEGFSRVRDESVAALRPVATSRAKRSRKKKARQSARATSADGTSAADASALETAALTRPAAIA